MYQPNYRITNQLLNQIAQIETYKSQVGSSYILPEREVELRHRATVEASHSSTSIEGNPLDVKQVEKVLSSRQSLTRHQYAEIEVKNYKAALDWVDGRKITGQPITTADILRIHQVLMKDLLPSQKIGAFRKNDVYIINQKDETVYVGPDAQTVGNEIESLLTWLNGEGKDVHPVIAAAILHFHFVSIHPFADGNGRSTRVLTMLYLGLRQYDFRGALVLDSYYSAEKTAYYQALDLGKTYDERQKAVLNPWVDYFTSGFLSSAKLLSIEITLLSNVVGAAEDRVRLSRDTTDILSYAKQFGSVNLSEASTILPKTARRTIQRHLQNLVKFGYLRLDGKGKNTRYIWKR